MHVFSHNHSDIIEAHRASMTCQIHWRNVDGLTIAASCYMRIIYIQKCTANSPLKHQSEKQYSSQQSHELRCSIWEAARGMKACEYLNVYIIELLTYPWDVARVDCTTLLHTLQVARPSDKKKTCLDQIVFRFGSCTQANCMSDHTASYSFHACTSCTSCTNKWYEMFVPRVDCFFEYSLRVKLRPTTGKEGRLYAI